MLKKRVPAFAVIRAAVNLYLVLKVARFDYSG